MLVGFRDVAGTLGEFASAFHQLGLEVSTCSRPNPWYTERAVPHIDLADVDAPPEWAFRNGFLYRYFRVRTGLANLATAFRQARKARTILLIGGETLLPLNLDLAILRLMGKRIIVFNYGSDIRHPGIQDIIDRELYGCVWHRFTPEVWKERYARYYPSFLTSLYRQRALEALTHTVLSCRNMATFQGRPLAHVRLPQRRLMDGPKRARTPPLIVHAPSDRAIKGTAYVLEAIERLRREGLAFEFELIEKATNDRVIDALHRADIVVDQATMTTAKLAAESLAAGCVVLGGNHPAYREMASPIIQFNPDSDELYRNLRRLVQDSTERQRLMDASYAHWQRYHAPEGFSAYARSVLDGTVGTFHPHVRARALIIEHAPGPLQRWLARCLYWPRDCVDWP